VSEGPFTLDSLGGGCPVQAEGKTAGGRPFYFRHRWGSWTLELDPWSDKPELVAEGEHGDGYCGFMTDEEVLEILTTHLANLTGET
jgi:hypothetical protein